MVYGCKGAAGWQSIFSKTVGLDDLLWRQISQWKDPIRCPLLVCKVMKFIPNHGKGQAVWKYRSTSNFVDKGGHRECNKRVAAVVHRIVAVWQFVF